MKLFKGFAIHGVEAKGEGLVHPEEGESLDGMCGNFKLFQLENGNKFSTDDLLVAWYGTSFSPSVHSVLDLGSGLGSVATIVAWRLPAARIVTIEAQEVSFRLAKKSVAYNGLNDRMELRLGDFRDSKMLSENEKFDLILGSPPYFPLEKGIQSEHDQKIACRFELRGDVSDYIRVASQHVTVGGVFALVFPIAPQFQEDRVLKAASENGLTILRRRNVVLKEGDAPLLGLFLMIRSEHLPEKHREKTYQEPNLTIRCKDGSIHPEYSAIKVSIGFPP